MRSRRIEKGGEKFNSARRSSLEDKQKIIINYILEKKEEFFM